MRSGKSKSPSDGIALYDHLRGHVGETKLFQHHSYEKRDKILDEIIQRKHAAKISCQICSNLFLLYKSVFYNLFELKDVFASD